MSQTGLLEHTWVAISVAEVTMESTPAGDVIPVITEEEQERATLTAAIGCAVCQVNFEEGRHTTCPAN